MNKYQEVKITKLMFGWSKYGGPRHGLVKKNKIDAWGEDKWSCQACGEEQPSDLMAYMIEFSPLEFVRICASCCAVANKRQINNLYFLIPYVRKHS